MKKLILLFSLLLLGKFGFSQLDNQLLYTANTDSIFSPRAKFGIFLDNVNYIRNTEYHSDIEHGATWAGTQIWPQVYYRYNSAITFKAGLFLQKDFGNNKFRTLIPTYTFSYTRNRFKVNFGTLEGSLDHNLIEPLYAIENFIDKRIENGLQIKGENRRLKYDLWIDWEKMIYRSSNTPELFTTGLSSHIKLIDNNNLKLNIPVQAVLRHQGGEIYTQPHSNIKTQVNLAYGLKLEKSMPNQFIDKISAQGYATFYEDLAPSKADSFVDGIGSFYALTLNHKNVGVMLNYWDAHQFISPLGEPLYLSKSKVKEGDYIQYRKMAMLRMMYQTRLYDNFTFVARINGIYNFSEKEFDNVIELYLKFNIGSNY